MADRVPLQSFLAALPRLEVALEEKSTDSQFTTRSTLPADYVWPDVEADSTPAPIVLMSAPGAMGKSYTSRAVAHALSLPRLDLAGVRVGANTLMGRLYRCLGPQVGAQFITSLGSGESGLILDGVDEAQLLAGRDHFIAFLEDLSELLEGAANKYQVVLLGRPDSMLVTQIALQEFGVPFANVRLTPLSQSQAIEVIDKTLDRDLRDGRPYRIHRDHPEPFAKLRETVLQDLSSGLGNTAPILVPASWHAVEDFLGYPPVLLALAARLRVDNPLDELNRIQNEQRTDRRAERGRLLREIVQHILDRESGKVRSRLSEALALRPDDKRIAVLYTRSEQVLRVMSVVSGANVAPLSPAVLTPEERSVYDEQVNTFVQDHPLLVDGNLANIVFADYVRAFVNSAPDAELHGFSRTDLLASCQAVGPFFVHFMQSLSNPAPSDAKDGESTDVGTLVNEDLVDDLIKSHSAGTSDVTFFFYTHDEHGAHLTLLASSPNSPAPTSHIFFHVNDPSGVLVLTSPVTRGVAVSSFAIVIESNRDETELGPGVIIGAVELQIEGHALFVNTKDRDSIDGTVSIVSEHVQHDPQLTVSAPAGGFTVGFLNAGHQWRKFQMNFDSHDDWNAGRTHQLVLATRRILTSFRGGAGEPSLYYEMLERLVVGRNEAAQIALAALRDVNVISRRGDSYVLHAVNLQPFGVSYADLRGPEFAKKLLPLVREIAKIPAVGAFLNLG